MPFPISIDGSVRLQVSSPDMLLPRVVEEIDALLSGELAKSVVVEGSVVHFRAGMFRRWITVWDILGAIGSGHLSVEAEVGSIAVRYHLSMVQLLLFVTTLAALVAALSWSTQGLNLFPALVWLCFFGGSYVLTLFRFPLWLQTGLEDMPEIRQSSAAA